jgi:hypothetical protein
MKKTSVILRMRELLCAGSDVAPRIVSTKKRRQDTALDLGGIFARAVGVADDRSLRDHLLTLLDSGNAHLKFDDAVEDSPPELRGKRPASGPHSAWELLEHLRITPIISANSLECGSRSYRSCMFMPALWPTKAAAVAAGS